MELLISGKFTKDELKELERNLSPKNIRVGIYLTKTIDTEEIVRLLFRDFDTFTLLRNGVLIKLLEFGIAKAAAFVRSKKQKAKISAGAKLHFKTKKGTIPVNVSLPVNNKEAWKELEKEVTVKFIDSSEEGEIVNVYWDIKEDKVKIKRMKL